MSKARREAQTGQALLEYVFLLLAVMGAASFIYGRMGRTLDILEAPLTKDFPFTYRYGDPKARGPDEGEATRHPAYVKPDNFRFFARGR